jgi:hypothetical protein
MRWTWDDLQSLPMNIYEVLVAELNREAEELARERERQRTKRR